MPTKKKTEEITDSIMEAQNETEEQNTAPPAAEEPTEKPKRTRKKKTEITETEEQPVNETVDLKRKTCRRRSCGRIRKAKEQNILPLKPRRKYIPSRQERILSGTKYKTHI